MRFGFSSPSSLVWSLGCCLGVFLNIFLDQDRTDRFASGRTGWDKSTEGLRDVFLGACLHNVASASPHNTGGYGQLMVNNYKRSRHPRPFPPCLFILRILVKISSYFFMIIAKCVKWLFFAFFCVLLAFLW
ncbi:hypothetical protein XENORESO_018517 [Xenotaenia resolanae]|uniref:Uncharacterized protein n=1 Tax=Xenotaenia resolanae TaxID=208358 RepID=A0ABV0W5A5_9TELE